MSEFNTPLLDTVNGPEDVKKLARADLPRLAAEIRSEIIRVVTRNGGHLASSLGAVELIIALHYVLSSPIDKIVFDVGHQAYAHKILTGRRREFESLRREGGLSGFPKRCESLCDDFDTGHSSTSISAALGLAVARDLEGGEHTVAAVIGDGALTGGMALEALNHAGALKKRLIVILNDNNMSISPNVGGLSEYLSLLVTKPAYVKFRKRLKGGLTQYLPTRGRSIVQTLRRIEDAVKSVFTSPSTLFEPMGLKYLGPFDGHEINTLIEGLKGAAGLDRPVLMHVITTKGKGYAPAEADPETFHGVGGGRGADEVAPPAPEAEKAAETFAGAFGRLLTAEAANDRRITAVTAAMSEGTGLAGFFEKFPERAFDVGIAEQHAVTLAAGQAVGGLRPVAAIYSSFLQRAFDQLYHDVALQNLPVLLAVDRAGLVGEDGPTHHGGLDLSYLRLLPNFTVMAPADVEELEAMIKLGLKLPGPSAIRYPRGPVPVSGRAAEGLAPGRGVVLKEGRDLVMLALGPAANTALSAAEALEAEGFSAAVINLRFIKPLDRELVLNYAQRTGRVLTLEENVLSGGLFGAVCELLAGRPWPIKGLAMATDEPVAQASQTVQRAWLGLDEAGVLRAARELAGLESCSRPLSWPQAAGS